MKTVLPALADSTLASAATNFTFTPVNAGVLFCAESYLICTTAIAAGNFSTTAPIVKIQATPSGGSTVDVASWTTSVPVAAGEAKALGDQFFFTADSTNAGADKAYTFTALTKFEVKVATAGAGGTTTGAARVVLCMELNNG